MKPAIPFRICAAILLLFAIGHTLGFLTFKPPTAEGLAVRSAMSQVSFHFGRTVHSYEDFYRGFSLSVTAYLLFGALLTWELPKLLAVSPELFRTISLGFMAVQIAGVALCLIYFAAPQAAFSLAVVVCLAWGMFLA